MGLLSEGKPLSWAETKKHAELVRRVGIKQFLATYHRLKERKGDTLKWGDEVSASGALRVCALRVRPPRPPRARTLQVARRASTGA